MLINRVYCFLQNSDETEPIECYITLDGGMILTDHTNITICFNTRPNYLKKVLRVAPEDIEKAFNALTSNVIESIYALAKKKEHQVLVDNETVTLPKFRRKLKKPEQKKAVKALQAERERHNAIVMDKLRDMFGFRVNVLNDEKTLYPSAITVFNTVSRVPVAWEQKDILCRRLHYYAVKKFYEEAMSHEDTEFSELPETIRQEISRAVFETKLTKVTVDLSEHIKDILFYAVKTACGDLYLIKDSNGVLQLAAISRNGCSLTSSKTLKSIEQDFAYKLPHKAILKVLLALDLVRSLDRHTKINILLNVHVSNKGKVYAAELRFIWKQREYIDITFPLTDYYKKTRRDLEVRKKLLPMLNQYQREAIVFDYTLPFTFEYLMLNSITHVAVYTASYVKNTEVSIYLCIDSDGFIVDVFCQGNGLSWHYVKCAIEDLFYDKHTNNSLDIKETKEATLQLKEKNTPFVIKKVDFPWWNSKELKYDIIERMHGKLVYRGGFDVMLSDSQLLEETRVNRMLSNVFSYVQHNPQPIKVRLLIPKDAYLPQPLDLTLNPFTFIEQRVFLSSEESGGVSKHIVISLFDPTFNSLINVKKWSMGIKLRENLYRTTDIWWEDGSNLFDMSKHGPLPDILARTLENPNPINSHNAELHIEQLVLDGYDLGFKTSPFRNVKFTLCDLLY